MGSKHSSEVCDIEETTSRRTHGYVENLLQIQQKNYLKTNCMESKEVLLLRRERILNVLKERKPIKPYALQLLEARAAAKKVSSPLPDATEEKDELPHYSQGDGRKQTPESVIDHKGNLLQRIAARTRSEQRLIESLAPEQSETGNKSTTIATQSELQSTTRSISTQSILPKDAVVSATKPTLDRSATASKTKVNMEYCTPSSFKPPSSQVPARRVQKPSTPSSSKPPFSQMPPRHVQNPSTPSSSEPTSSQMPPRRVQKPSTPSYSEPTSSQIPPRQVQNPSIPSSSEATFSQMPPRQVPNPSIPFSSEPTSSQMPPRHVQNPSTPSSSEPTSSQMPPRQVPNPPIPSSFKPPSSQMPPRQVQKPSNQSSFKPASSSQRPPTCSKRLSTPERHPLSAAPRLSTLPPLSDRQAVNVNFSLPNPPSASESNFTMPSAPSIGDLLECINKDNNGKETLLGLKPIPMEEKMCFGLKDHVVPIHTYMQSERYHQRNGGTYDINLLDYHKESFSKRHTAVVDRLTDSLIAGWSSRSSSAELLGAGETELSLLSYGEARLGVPHRPVMKNRGCESMEHFGLSYVYPDGVMKQSDCLTSVRWRKSEKSDPSCDWRCKRCRRHLPQ